MAFDIITIAPTVSDGAHGAGDVVFNLTEFKIPSRACKIINCFMEVSAGGGEDTTKIGLLFFQKNTTAALGTLNLTANISAANFKANQYIGSAFLGRVNAHASIDLDVIDNTALYYSIGPFGDTSAVAAGEGAPGSPVVLKGDAGSSSIFVGGVVHEGAPDLDGTDNVKIHIHVEY